jgi:hypothetical protein
MCNKTLKTRDLGWTSELSCGFEGGTLSGREEEIGVKRADGV